MTINISCTFSCLTCILPSVSFAVFSQRNDCALRSCKAALLEPSDVRFLVSFQDDVVLCKRHVLFIHSINNVNISPGLTNSFQCCWQPNGSLEAFAGSQVQVAAAVSYHERLAFLSTFGICTGAKISVYSFTTSPPFPHGIFFFGGSNQLLALSLGRKMRYVDL